MRAKVYLQLYRRGQDAERALRRLATVLFTEKRPENDSTDLFGRISIDLMRCKGMLEAGERREAAVCMSRLPTIFAPRLNLVRFVSRTSSQAKKNDVHQSFFHKKHDFPR